MSFLKNMRMNLEDLGQGKGGGSQLQRGKLKRKGEGLRIASLYVAGTSFLSFKDIHGIF